MNYCNNVVDVAVSYPSVMDGWMDGWMNLQNSDRIQRVRHPYGLIYTIILSQASVAFGMLKLEHFMHFHPSILNEKPPNISRLKMQRTGQAVQCSTGDRDLPCGDLIERIAGSHALPPSSWKRASS